MVDPEDASNPFAKVRSNGSAVMAPSAEGGGLVDARLPYAKGYVNTFGWWTPELFLKVGDWLAAWRSICLSFARRCVREEAGRPCPVGCWPDRRRPAPLAWHAAGQGAVWWYRLRGTVPAHAPFAPQLHA